MNAITLPVAGQSRAAPTPSDAAFIAACSRHVENCRALRADLTNPALDKAHAETLAFLESWSPTTLPEAIALSRAALAESPGLGFVAGAPAASRWLRDIAEMLAEMPIAATSRA